MTTDVFLSVGTLLSPETTHAVYWFFAIFGSLAFGLSGILHLLGLTDTSSVPDDLDLDLDGDIDIPHTDTGLFDFKLFSVRTILAFFTMFGWGGVIFGDRGWIGFAIAVCCGLVMMLLTALSISMILKLQQNGTVKNQHFTGSNAIVYLTIPGGRKGKGKVTVVTESGTREFSAVCDTVELPTGTPVLLQQYLGDSLFLVVPVPESESNQNH